MSLLNVPKQKAPNTMHYMNEYQYNDGYYFEACELSHDIEGCNYLDFGCTGCDAARHKIELTIKANDTVSKKLKNID